MVEHPSCLPPGPWTPSFHRNPTSAELAAEEGFWKRVGLLNRVFPISEGAFDSMNYDSEKISSENYPKEKAKCNEIARIITEECVQKGIVSIIINGEVQKNSDQIGKIPVVSFTEVTPRKCNASPDVIAKFVIPTKKGVVTKEINTEDGSLLSDTTDLISLFTLKHDAQGSLVRKETYLNVHIAGHYTQSVSNQESFLDYMLGRLPHEYHGGDGDFLVDLSDELV